MVNTINPAEKSWIAPEQCRPNDAYVGIVRTSTGTHQRILRRTGMHTFGPWEYWGSLEEGGPKFATDDDVSELVEIDPFVARNLVNAEADRDRWRRAHEIVEQERDQARASLHEACKVAQSYKVDAYQATERAEAAERERDEWKARAEAAEARTAPAVTRDDIEKAIRGKTWAANREPNKAGFHRVHIAWATDSVWSLVSGADPAVFVVRESDVAAVEVRRASDGWYADGAWLASADETAEWVRDRAAEMVVCAARNEAVARAIEQDAATDPLLGKAQEFAALADWELTDREAELLHTVAAHVLGQESGDERS